MSTDLIRELHNLGIDIGALNKIQSCASLKVQPEMKLKRYHALLNRISKCSEVDVTPDELISSLKHKEY